MLNTAHGRAEEPPHHVPFEGLRQHPLTHLPIWQWQGKKLQGFFFNVLVIRGPCIFTSLSCMELLPLSKLKLGTFYFKMTLQGLLVDIHFNSSLILHNSHMIQCVCFMRQTWHMKIKNRLLVWNTERDWRGKRKKTMRVCTQRWGWREKGRKTGWDVSRVILPRVKTAFISMKDN